MGAVTNLRPDLFKAVVSQVPFVDVINTMLDETLPLTVGEFEEWGNPKKPDEYAYMQRYCPYTTSRRRPTRRMLVKTSFNDSQVMYWEPAKYVARLRTLKTDANPLLLKTNMAAGHGGASGRYDFLREVAFDYAFMLSQMGITSENAAQLRVAGRWVAGAGRSRDAREPGHRGAAGAGGRRAASIGARRSTSRARGAGRRCARCRFAERGALLRAVCDAIQAHRDELLDLAIANGGNTRSDAKFDIDGATFTLAAYAELGKSLGDAARARRRRGHPARPHAALPRPARLGPAPRRRDPHQRLQLPGLGPGREGGGRAARRHAGGRASPPPARRWSPTASWRSWSRSRCCPRARCRCWWAAAGDLLEHLGPQDVVAFTGSGATGELIRALPPVIRNSVRVNVEADSLNAAVLGPDAEPGCETYDFFVKDVLRDMTQKAGQKCTAIRRVLVPAAVADRVRERPRRPARVASWSAIRRTDGVRMGPVATAQQLKDVREGIDALARDGRLVFGHAAEAGGRARGQGLLRRPGADRGRAGGRGAAVHAREVFGPVATVVPYDGHARRKPRRSSRAAAAAWCRRSIPRTSRSRARSCWASRRSTAASSSAAPRSRSSRRGPAPCCRTLVHGGPGRAGGGEELGGLRGLGFYMQRVALEGSRPVIDRITGAKPSA